MKITEKQFLKLVRITQILRSEFKRIVSIELLGRPQFEKECKDPKTAYPLVNPKDQHIAIVVYKGTKTDIRVALSDNKSAVNALNKCLKHLMMVFCPNDKQSKTIAKIIDRLNELDAAECGYAYLVKFGVCHDGDFDYGISQVPYSSRKKAAKAAEELTRQLGVQNHRIVGATAKDFEKGGMVDCPLSHGGNGYQVEILAYAVFPEKYGV